MTDQGTSSQRYLDESAYQIRPSDFPEGTRASDLNDAFADEGVGAVSVAANIIRQCQRKGRWQPLALNSFSGVLRPGLNWLIRQNYLEVEGGWIKVSDAFVDRCFMSLTDGE